MASNEPRLLQHSGCENGTLPQPSMFTLTHPLGQDAPRQRAVPIFPLAHQPCTVLKEKICWRDVSEIPCLLHFKLKNWKLKTSVSSSQPLYYHTLRLTINNFRQKGIQLHIQQSKKLHPYSFAGVNFEIGHMFTL